jgi:hypothetical protein
MNEDDIDSKLVVPKGLLWQKNIMIAMLGFILIVSLFAMTQQVAMDNKACENRILLEKADACGLAVYDVNSGQIRNPNTSVLNISLNMTR